MTDTDDKLLRGADEQPLHEADEQLLRHFFASSPQEIADDGFTRRVMQQLPDNLLRVRRMRRLSRLWTATCCSVALLLFVHFDGFRLVWNTLREVFLSTAQSAVTNLDPQSILIALVVLLVLGCKKAVSMA